MAAFCKASGMLYCMLSVVIALASLVNACTILSRQRTLAPNVCESLCSDWSMATFQTYDFPHTSCTWYMCIQHSIFSSPFIYVAVLGGNRRLFHLQLLRKSCLKKLDMFYKQTLVWDLGAFLGLC